MIPNLLNTNKYNNKNNIKIKFEKKLFYSFLFS